VPLAESSCEGPMKIMAVDHETKTSTLLRSVAIPLGYTVQSSDDYDLGIQKVESQHFDVVFVGMHSPEHDGEAAIKMIARTRKSGPNRNSMIVMLSPTEDISGLRRAIGEGADLFVIKPVSGERLTRMLTAFPQWRETRQAARLPLVTDVVCTSSGRQLTARSLNISESGMLLQSGEIKELRAGQEIQLEFKIGEINSSLKLNARVVRKEGADRIGVGFNGPAPEDTNAIHLYVTGKMKDPGRPLHDYWKGTRQSKSYPL